MDASAWAKPPRNRAGSLTGGPRVGGGAHLGVGRDGGAGEHGGGPAVASPRGRESLEGREQLGRPGWKLGAPEPGLAAVGQREKHVERGGRRGAREDPHRE